MGMDVQGALQRMGGNAGILQRSLRAFIAQAQALPERMQSWGPAMADVTSAQRDMHSFKGLAGTMGVAPLAETAYILEQTLKKDAWADLPAARDSLCQSIGIWLPKMQEVADRLLPSGPALAADAVTDSQVPGEWLEQLQALHTALQASDMGAMELHAQLRCIPVAGLDGAMEPLDAAMADLDFDQAAVECGKLIQQLAAVTRQ